MMISKNWKEIRSRSKYCSVPVEEGWSAFLNIKIRNAGGHMETKQYKKPARKEHTSAHPTMKKRQMIMSIFKTASELSSTENRQKGRNRVKKITFKNGYHGEAVFESWGGHKPIMMVL